MELNNAVSIPVELIAGKGDAGWNPLVLGRENAPISPIIPLPIIEPERLDLSINIFKLNLAKAMVDHSHVLCRGLASVQQLDLVKEIGTDVRDYGYRGHKPKFHNGDPWSLFGNMSLMGKFIGRQSGIGSFSRSFSGVFSSISRDFGVSQSEQGYSSDNDLDATEGDQDRSIPFFALLFVGFGLGGWSGYYLNVKWNRVRAALIVISGLIGALAWWVLLCS